MNTSKETICHMQACIYHFSKGFLLKEEIVPSRNKFFPLISAILRPRMFEKCLFVEMSEKRERAFLHVNQI